MSSRRFYNTGVLARLILRRDRIRMPVWILSLVLITILVAISFSDMYSLPEERQAMAEVMINPAMVAMVGPGYGLDNYTLGAMMAHQMIVFTALTIGIMSILLVSRHTRSDEEDGRIEMIRSLPTGHLSSLNATILTVFGVNVILALLIGFGLYGLNIESMDLEGSLLYGAALGATGIFFTALTAFFAQVCESSRGTIGYSFAVLLGAYLLRAVGDVSNETLTWISPLGWGQSTQVYVNNYWGPLIIPIGLAIFLSLLALYFNAKRDLGAGLIPAKPGRKNASKMLQTPLGFSVRLQRTSIIAWAIGMFILGASYGSILGDTEAFFQDIEMMQELLNPIEGYSLTEQFLAMLMAVISMICTIPALLFMLKLKGEERNNRTEHLLARAVSRIRIMGSYYSISIIGGASMLCLAALGLGAAALSVIEEGISLWTILGSALVYLPAMGIMIGLTVLLIGLKPNWSGIIWMYLVYSFIVVYLGGLFRFPEWMSKITPFGLTPQLPIEELNYVPFGLMSLAAILLTIVGFIGYKKRDIEG